VTEVAPASWGGVSRGEVEHRERFEMMFLVIDTLALGPDDWRLWRELRLAALAEAPAAFGSTMADWSGAGDTERRWRERLAGVALNLILTWENEPVGMVSALAPDGAGLIELISLWVAPSARGRGVGDEAVRQVVAWARREHPAGRVVLDVKSDNERAIGLYRRHGFTDAGASPRSPDERLMRL
jgi:ribosomal protein S18 acetylase RimI-like enzyme